MKIVFLADRLVMGGLETHIVTFTNELLRRGHHILLYTASVTPQVLSQIQDEGNRFQHIQWTDDLLHDIHPFEPDLIHAHPFTAIIKGRKLAEALGKPLIVTMHGHYDFGLDRSTTGYKVSEVVKRVIAVDFRVAKVLINNIAHPEKVSIIRNGIDLNMFHSAPLEPTARSQFGGNPEWFTLAAVTRLADDKEQSVLQLIRCAPALADRLKGLNVFIVGDGAHYNKIKEESDAVSGHPRLRIRCVGSQDDVRPFITMSNIVLACDRAALETMACQRPVFAMRFGFAGAVDKHNHHEILFHMNGFHAISDNELIDQLVELAADEALRNQLVEDGYKVICRYYDISTSVTQLERIYNQYV